ncbi:MAG: hypothetical protein R8K21_04790 [Mariprofundales bacterium]
MLKIKLLLLILCFPLGLLLTNHNSDDETASLKLILGIVVASLAYWLVSSPISPITILSVSSVSLILQQMVVLSLFISIAGVSCIDYWSTRQFVLFSMIIGGFAYPADLWLLQENGVLFATGILDIAGALSIYATAGCLLLAFALNQRELNLLEKTKTNLSPAILVLLGLGIFGTIALQLTLDTNGINGQYRQYGQANYSLDMIFILLWLAILAGILSATIAVKVSGESVISLHHVLGGGLAALVASSASVGQVHIISAVVIGAIAGSLFIFALLFLLDLGIVLQSSFFISLCAVSGIWGSLAAGLFFYNDSFNAQRIIIQLIGIGILCLSSYLLGRIFYSNIGYIGREKYKKLSGVNHA